MDPASPVQRRELVTALQDVGAPADVAMALADLATLERHDGLLMLCLKGSCSHVDDVDDGRDVRAVGLSAENAAAAEAVDRQRRDDPGREPWWPLPRRDGHDRSRQPWSTGPMPAPSAKPAAMAPVT